MPYKFLEAVEFSSEQILEKWGVSVGKDLHYYGTHYNFRCSYRDYRKPPILVLKKKCLQAEQCYITCPEETLVEKWVAWRCEGRYLPFAIKTHDGKIVFANIQAQDYATFKLEFMQAMDALLGTNEHVKYLLEIAEQKSIKIERVVLRVDKDELAKRFKEQLEGYRKLTLEEIEEYRRYALERIAELEHQADENYHRGILEGINIATKVSNIHEWQCKDYAFVYTKEIFVEYLHRGGMLKRIKTNKLYVEGLRVYYDRAEGGWVADVENGRHPNVGSSGQVCLGELENAPLPMLLENLPNALRVANLDSAYEGEGTEIAEELWNEEESEQIFNTES